MVAVKFCTSYAFIYNTKNRKLKHFIRPTDRGKSGLSYAHNYDIKN